MPALLARLTAPGAVTFTAGAAATLAAAYLTSRLGFQVGLGALAAAAFALTVTLTALVAPHLAVAGVIALFTVIPALKVFVSPGIGGLKEVCTLSLLVASGVLAIIDKRRPDRMVTSLVGLLLALYVIDAGGGHGIAWAQGVRLVGEPLLLLLVGMTLPDPRRTLRYAVAALIVASCLVALYGLVQQVLGDARLVSLGYTYGDQVRTAGSRLRSFGTFDDPFAYAGFLIFGLVALVFAGRRVPFRQAVGALLLLGLTVSFVRTALLILAGVVGLELSRRGRQTTAVLVLSATGILAMVLIATGAQGSQSQTRAVRTSLRQATAAGAQPTTVDILLNGRISAWRAAIGDNPRDWFFGRGVGTVGTAAQRATYKVVRKGSADDTTGGQLAVDSGYLATIADVGVVGLAVLLALIARLIALARRGGPARGDPSWLALGFLVVLLLDALTRASFTGFPTAFLGLLVVGLALSAAASEP